MKNIFVLALVIFLYSCGEKKVVEYNSIIDTPSYWGGLNTLTSENAFSGELSSRVDSNTNFSFGFGDSINNIGLEKINLVHVNLKVFVTDVNSNAHIVCSVDSAGNSLYWEGSKITDQGIKMNMWQDVKATFDVSSLNSKDARISSYVWSTGNDVVYIDNFSIKFE